MRRSLTKQQWPAESRDLESVALAHIDGADAAILRLSKVVAPDFLERFACFIGIARPASVCAFTDLDVRPGPAPPAPVVVVCRGAARRLRARHLPAQRTARHQLQRKVRISSLGAS